MEPDWLRAVISSADFRVQLEILKVPYRELFFVAPTRWDLGALAESIKTRKINDFGADSAPNPGFWLDFCATEINDFS